MINLRSQYIEMENCMEFIVFTSGFVSLFLEVKMLMSNYVEN